VEIQIGKILISQEKIIRGLIMAIFAYPLNTQKTVVNTSYQCEETYVHRLLILDRDNANVYPVSVEMNIYDRCGNQVVTDGSMVTDATGYYEYAYSIPTDCLYGEYTVKVIATDSDNQVAIFEDYFYVFPWNIIHDVRRYSGIKSKKSINEHDIAALIWEAYNEALDEVYEYWHNDIPNCNPDDSKWFDGTNTVFETKHSPIADRDGDGTVQGYGEASCGTDIDGWWKDADGDCHRVYITVNDAHCGKITITQTDGTAIPNNAEWVRINYHTEWETYNERMFRFAVAYLAAYKCIEAFKALDKATMADLHSNKQDIYMNKNRMEKLYKRTMRKIKKPVIGAGMLPGS